MLMLYHFYQSMYIIDEKQRQFILFVCRVLFFEWEVYQQTKSGTVITILVSGQTTDNGIKFVSKFFQQRYKNMIKECCNIFDNHKVLQCVRKIKQNCQYKEYSIYQFCYERQKIQYIICEQKKFMNHQYGSQGNHGSHWKSEPVMGLRVEGHELKPQMIQVDSTFEKCPIAHAAGIPLYVKRLFNQPRKKSNNYIIVRMMSEPQDGVAPLDWQYGGQFEPAPSVLVARNDSIQFNIKDWEILDDFEMAMLDDGPRNVRKNDFINFVKTGYEDKHCNIVLEVLFPKGRKCKINGMINKVQLNGKIGTFNGNYENERVGIDFIDPQGKYAIKPDNIKLL